MADSSVDRREFMKAAAVIGAGVVLGQQGGSASAQEKPAGEAGSGGAGDAAAASGIDMATFRVEPLEKVRIGFVGVGGRGTGLVRNYMKCPGVEIKAVCDVRADHAARAQDIVVKAGHEKPEAYTKGDHDFERLCSREDLDLVITATPWEWHVPVAMDALTKGKHAFTEVPAALMVADCWKLVDTAEKTKRHCAMMENCCYGESELAVLNACRQGVFGELLHGEGGYLHDLQGVKFDEDGEGFWRRKYSTMWNGNTYPTHGLGPVAQYMGINRGDRFDYIVSMASPARGLKEYAESHLKNDDPRRKEVYVQGDVNVSIIRTVKGRTIIVQHDTNTARPYSRINTIVGTKGTFCGYPDRVGIGEEWGDIAAFLAKYEHPLWKKTKEAAKGSGHGGMDFVMAYRFIDCLRRGLPLDQNIYDGAAWSSIVELSIKSTGARSAAQDVPDFTRGRWERTEALGIVT